MKKIKFLFFILISISILQISDFKKIRTFASTQEEYYLHKNSNVDTINATTVGALPCIGTPKVLVFYTDFLNGEKNWDKTKEEVEDFFFSEEAKNDSSLAYSDKDSLRSYYWRSSNGKVDITGTVYEYQTKNDTSYYQSLDVVLDEIINVYRNIINWSDYDTNNDGYIDGIYVIPKNSHSFYGPNFVGSYYNEVNNKNICKACFVINTSLSTLLHETCHMFGPADMYTGVSVNPDGIKTISIMENGNGDLPSPTKYVLGWLDDVTYIDSSNVGQYNLKTYSKRNNVLIIYPNGNKNNKNWFFVEYVTNEGNNLNEGYGEFGVRVWKTQMYIDEYNNIIGSTEYCGGMPNSPYEYLEAVHPNEVWNYYLKPGEEITPYTNPSTSYSDTFEIVGGSKRFKDLTFSGINISFLKIENDQALVDVKIEESPIDKYVYEAKINAINYNESSSFIHNSKKAIIFELEYTMEMKIKDNLCIVNETEDLELELEGTLYPDKRRVYYSLDYEQLKIFKSEVKWKIKDLGLYTYFDVEINIDRSNNDVNSSYVKMPLDEKEMYNDIFHHEIEANTKIFELSEDVMVLIYVENSNYIWCEINITENTVEKTILETPDILKNDYFFQLQHIRFYQLGEYFITEYANKVCCYKNKELVDYLDFTTLDAAERPWTFGDNINYYSTLSNDFYEISIKNNKIVYNKLELEYIDDFEIPKKNVYNYFEKQYIFVNDESIYLYDLKTNTSKFVEFEINDDNDRYGSYTIYVEYYNNRYYVFQYNSDLIMWEYDLEFNLINKKVLLKDLSNECWGPFNGKMIVEHMHNQWFVIFDSVSLENVISYASTFIFIFMDDGTLVNFYRYGDESYRFDCAVKILDSGSILCVDEYEYFYLTSICNHDYSKRTVIVEATCLESGIEKVECALCGKYLLNEIMVKEHDIVCCDELKPTCTEKGHKAYEYCTMCEYTTLEEIDPLGHDRVYHEAKDPTCTEVGHIAYETCTRCDYTTFRELPALGHELIHYDKLEATCEENGHNEYDECTRCGYSTYVEVRSQGHQYSAWYTVKEPTCKTRGQEEKKCSICGDIDEKYINPLGHKLIDVTPDMGYEQNVTQVCTRCDYEVVKKNTSSDCSYLGSIFVGNFVLACILLVIKKKK